MKTELSEKETSITELVPDAVVAKSSDDLKAQLTAKLAKLRDYFDGVYQELAKFTSPANERVDSDILIYQVPGGMLSNLAAQLAEQNALEKMRDVLEEVPRVRKDMGYPPLVTKRQFVPPKEMVSEPKP